MPAIYDLANRGLLPPSFSLVGFARRDWSTRTSARWSSRPSRSTPARPFRQEVWDRLAEGFRFVPGAFDDEAAFGRLAETLDKLDAERGTGGNHAFYLAIPPKSFPVVCEQLHKSGSGPPAGRAVEPGGHREAVRPRPGERPGTQRRRSTRSFPEESVFRIDHYLGKETVQNILALRFANELFEPIWNAHYVDHVQITMAEDIGLGGRAGYYDGIGAARDVIQNHLMQLLALTAMEEPVSFNPSALQAEKIKVLSATQLARAARRDHAAAASTPRAGRAARTSSGCSTKRASPRTRPPRRSPPSRSRWTPAAGPACRSTCEPENAWAAG